MNEYLIAFQRITESVEPLLKDEQSSLEIKQAVTTLKQSVEPCFIELKDSATKLKSRIQLCFENLYHAEDVWNSKQRIVEIPTLEIWEKIGELSARTFRIRRLGEQCESEAIEKMRNNWCHRERILTKKYFYNQTNFKDGLNIFEKNYLVSEFNFELRSQLEVVKQILIKSTDLIINHEIQYHIPFIQTCINQLDEKQKFELITKLNSISESTVNIVEKAFNAQLYKSSTSVTYLVNSVSNAADNLGKEGLLGISWHQFNKCSKEVMIKLETIVVIVFEELIRLAEQAIEQTLAFHNDFLERQMRYRQETQEQRAAEKAWIEQQLQELTQVQNGIEVILNHCPATSSTVHL
ncbi:hypothetical protein DP113_13900 [Brasilonema octagenarum UFV-E1]|uniref:Uncharacterized protein n=2 Tax=Brasilonema TaxID=383614 RepID=A0A856MEZ4_9CYAN|nr:MULTISPECIES: hypothetical protein [Brasilonema]NMF64638.1 hypothetical protein [Brasilonema octagenarum UFV-OR1]QDL08850.1 hypothetical protein DP114_13960 [Brasilonema sennae CENA114]QDL15207.1 hypothetical protein DP113_13900 [Brasilonema octagenarum UFV-E1]